MNTILLSSSRNIAKAGVALAIVFIGLLAAASPAFAGVAVSVGPSFPSSVTVGTNNIAVSMSIINNSTDGDGSPLTLNSIKLIPSCGAIAGGSCTSLDPVVFNVDPAGTGAGACAVNTFTIAETDISSGEVTFTPNATITLNPGQTCTINFTVDAIAVPDIDATGAAGLQTLQLGSVDGVDQLLQPGSGTGSDTTTVSKASPSIATLQSAGGPIGTILNDTATLTGGASPTGSVTFKLFPPSDASCAGAPAYTDVDASAPYATSPGFASNEAGVWHWTADYAGDANNNATSSPCTAEPVTITQATPSISTVPSAGGPIGTILNDTAALSGGSSPTGNVTFKLFPPTDALCAGAPVYTDVDASAPYATSPGYASLIAGTYRWTADYAGDSNNMATSSGCQEEQVTITKNSPTIATVLSTFATTTGAFVYDTSTLSGATATAGGTVTYSVFTDNTCTAGKMDAGTKVVTNGIVPNSNALQFNNAGTFYWQAVYSGDAANNAATSTCTEEVLVVSQPQGGQYCSPGYWKQPQHFDSWVTYLPTQKFSAVFGVAALDVGKNKKAASDPTLVEALNANGGGINVIMRKGVDALLNSTAFDPWSFTTAQVIAAVQQAVNTNNPALLDQFDLAENCPLN